MSFYDFGKRIIDIIGAIAGIFLFSPVMLIAALHIKRVSPEGPIFADIPLRVGKGGKMFKMFKFRSMIPNAHQYLLDHADLHQYYIENNYKIEAEKDPRIIPGGRYLRKTSIDELPQFFNVLFGQMSLVGPRAYYKFEVEDQCVKFPEAKEYMDKVLEVKPGITGLWQISGRSQLNFVERVRLDAKYALKKSLLYDILIILKTPFVVLKGEGAY